jgi:hypothetical protein
VDGLVLEGDLIIVENRQSNASPPELEEWLRRASANLIPSACESIRREIASHYKDAVADAIRSGMPETDAIDSALRNLGSPRRANRQYSREYLTDGEWTMIGRVLQNAANGQAARQFRSIFTRAG